jgi:TNF receptor-associated factor 4
MQDSRMEGCFFIPIECTYCKREFQWQFMPEHEQTECSKRSRPATCKFCNEYESTFEDTAMNHMSICPSRLVECPNDCGEAVQRKELDAHLSDVCSLEVISCYAGCDKRLLRRDMPTHIN